MSLVLINPNIFAGGVPPLTNFVYQSIDQEVSNDLQSALNGNRNVVRTKGYGIQTFLDVDNEISMNNLCGVESGKTCVRDSKGNIYVISREYFLDGDACELWMSVDEGANFNIIHNFGDLTDGTYKCPSIAIDSNDIIHAVGYDAPVGVRYATYDTRDDTVPQALETAHAEFDGQTEQMVVISIDANDKPHLCFGDTENGVSSHYYMNKIGASWSTPIIIKSDPTFDCAHSSITMDGDNVAQIVCKSFEGGIISVHRANQNDATTFENHEMEFVNNEWGCDILVDPDAGTTSICFTNDATQAVHIRHFKNKKWTIWNNRTTTTAIDRGQTGLSQDNAGDVHWWNSSEAPLPEVVQCFKSPNGSGGFFNALSHGMPDPFGDEWVRPRWSFYNYHFPDKLDYTVCDRISTDFGFNTLLTVTDKVWRDTDSPLGTNHGNDLGARTTVRSSTGILYMVQANLSTTDVEMMRSGNEGVTWTEEDSGNSPTDVTISAVACAIDSTDLIHVIWWDDGVGLRYQVFDTSTDLWVGSDVTAKGGGFSTSSYPFVSIAIDEADIPHVAFVRDQSGSEIHIIYSNRVGGNWIGDLDLASIDPENPILVDLCMKGNVPQMAINYNVGGGGVIHVKEGENNDPSFFLNFSIDGTAVSDMPSMVVDKKGDTYVSWVEADGDLQVTKHLNGTAWSTVWEADVEVAAGTFEDTSMTIDRDGYPIVFSNNDSNVTFAYISKDSGVTWTAINTSHDSTSFGDEHIRTRWAYNNHHFIDNLDYSMSNETADDIMYNKLFAPGKNQLAVIGRSDIDEVECWVSTTEGVTWEEIDHLNAPISVDSDSVSCAMGYTDAIAISWFDSGLGLRVSSINWATQLFGTKDTALSDTTAGSGQWMTALTLDYANRHHIVFMRPTNPTNSTLEYINFVGATWNSPVVVNAITTSNTYRADIAVNNLGFPEIVEQRDSADLNIHLGNTNNATSFFEFQIADAGSHNLTNFMPSICCDDQGNTHMAFVHNSDVYYRKHLNDIFWLNWEAEVLVGTGTYEDVSLTLDKDDHVIITSNSSGNITTTWVTDDEGLSFYDKSTHNTPNVVDQNVHLRQSSIINRNNPNVIDYTIYDVTAGDTYYNKGAYTGDGTQTPLFNFTFNDIDNEFSRDLQATDNGARCMVRTKGYVLQSYQSIDTEIATNNENTGGARNTVRTSAGIIYSVSRGISSSDAEMHKSFDDGANWTEEDSGGVPTGVDNLAISCAIDSADIIHVVWWDIGVGSRYCTFDTSDDTWGTPETIESQATFNTDLRTAITIDSADKPHVVWRARTGFPAFSYYSNRISGSWKSKVTVETASGSNFGFDLTINTDDIPQMVYTHGGNVRAKLGNQNDASSFELFTISISSIEDFASSMVIDKQGNTIVAWVTNDIITTRRHLRNKAWSVWEASVNIGSGTLYQDVSMTMDQAGDLYIFSTKTTDITEYWKSKNGGITWETGVTDNMGTISDDHVRTRWSYLNYHFPWRLDYTLNDSNDIYFNTVLTDTSVNWRDIDVVVDANAYRPLGSRNIIRLINGYLYHVSVEAGADTVQMFKSTDEGVSWTQLDTGSEPVTNGGAVTCALDSAGLIQVIYYDLSVGVRYVIFDSSTDTWGTPETAKADTSVPASEFVCLSIDSNDKPHVTWVTDVSNQLSFAYTNKVSGSWSSTSTIVTTTGTDNFGGMDLTVDENDLSNVAICYQTGGQNTVKSFHGNTVTPSSWVQGFSDTSQIDLFQTSIVIDHGGNIIVSYEDDGDPVTKTHFRDQPIGTWENIQTIEIGTFEDTSLTISNSGNIIVMYNDSSNTLYMEESDNFGDTYHDLSGNHSQVGTNNENVRLRWAFNNYYFKSQYDYTTNGTASDTYYNKACEQVTDHLYIVGRNPTDNEIEVWFSPTEGNTWEEVDDPNSPTGSNINAVSCALDSNDDIHITWWSDGTGVRYEIFSMPTQSHGTAETAHADTNTVQAEREGCAISMDLNDKPHVVFITDDAVGENCEYINKISGWSTPLEVQGSGIFEVDITIDQNNLPQIIARSEFNSIFVEIGNANDPSFFSEHELSTAAISKRAPSIVVDKSGNTHVTYCAGLAETNGDVAFYTHLVGDPWTTWQSQVVPETGFFMDTNLTIDELGNLYIITSENNNYTRVFVSQDNGLTWDRGNKHYTGKSNYHHHRFRWSYYNYHNPSKLDYVLHSDVTGVDKDIVLYNSGVFLPDPVE